MNETYLLTEKYEILESNNGDCYIKDIENKKYFFRSKYYASDKMNVISQKKITWNCKDTGLAAVLLLAVIGCCFIFFNYKSIYNFIQYDVSMYIFSMIFLLLNIFLHEFCHMLVLHLYGRKIGKFRFRFNFIFPAFSVNTSDSYVLPKYRRFFAYIAGIEVNIIICALTFLIFPQYSYILRPIVWAAIINLIPIGFLKTDGYHILVNLMMNIKDLKTKPMLLSVLGRYLFAVLTVVFVVISMLNSFGIIV